MGMLKCWEVVVLCIALSTSVASARGATDSCSDAALSQLRSRVVDLLLPQPPDDGCNISHRVTSAAIRYSVSLQPSSNWSDVNYVTEGSEGRSWWDTGVHLQRVLLLGVAANLNLTNATTEPLVSHALVRSLGFWLQNDFVQSNWWWNIIGTPQAIGKAMLLLGAVNNTAFEAFLPLAWPIVNRANFSHGETGTNLAWVSNGQLLLGLMECNMSRAAHAFSVAATTAGINYLGQGIQQDSSFHMHGPQLYSGWGYGAIWTTLMLSFSAFSVGQDAASQLKFSPNTLSAVGSDMILDGQRWMTAGQNFDFTTSGRLMTYFSNTTGPEQLNWGHYHYYAAFTTFANAFPDFHCYNRTPLAVNFANLLPMAAPAFSNETAVELQQFATEIESADIAVGRGLSGHRAFWNSDYHVHRRNTSLAVRTANGVVVERSPFVTSIRMVSNRTLNSECVNEEGKQGWDLADGVTTSYVHGTEFENVFPLWDWHGVPGTIEVHEPPPSDLVKSCAEVQDRGRGQHFVGGVSDGADGVSAMDFVEGPIHVHRSWFAAGRTIVMMGTGTVDGTTDNVTLSLDQKWSNGPISYQLAGADPTSILDGSVRTPAQGLRWIHHSGIGFVVLNASTSVGETSARFFIQNRTGSWNNITQGSSDPVSGVVMQAAIDYGAVTSTRSIQHEVVLLPGIAAADMQVYDDTLQNVSWLQRINGFDAQAVCWPVGGDESVGTGQLMQSTIWYSNATVSLHGCFGMSIDVAPSNPGGLTIQARATLSNDGQHYILAVTVADPHTNGGPAKLRLTDYHGRTWSGDSCVSDGNDTVISLTLAENGPGVAAGQGAGGSSSTVTCVSAL